MNVNSHLIILNFFDKELKDLIDEETNTGKHRKIMSRLLVNSFCQQHLLHLIKRDTGSMTIMFQKDLQIICAVTGLWLC